jgi:beta-glucanase (GH16 family)
MTMVRLGCLLLLAVVSACGKKPGAALPPDSGLVRQDTGTPVDSLPATDSPIRDAQPAGDTPLSGQDTRGTEVRVPSPDASTRLDSAGLIDATDGRARLPDGLSPDLGRPETLVPDASPPDVAKPDTTTTDADIPVPPGMKLVWSDEFNVDGAPNPANWKFEQGFARNEEAQWYQADNASVKGGFLIIEARKERKANPNYVAGSSDWKTSRQYAEYTSSSLLTSGLHSWQFGRFEMRAKIPTQAGMWPAWWTLGVAGEWPSNGEIDIMEFYKGKILANVACGTTTRWSAKWDSATKALTSFPDPDWANQFHVWRMDWNTTKIDLYVDDALLNTTNLADMLNPDGASPFRQKHYMLVNLALGGNNGGDPSGSTFPARFEVDYVRVFQTQ